MKIELDVEIPEGYEATGELRLPKRDEWFLYLGYGHREAMQAGHDYVNVSYVILRKREDAQ